MSRIFKSSYVYIGETKEISTTSDREVQHIDLDVEELEAEDYEMNIEEVFEQKLKEMEFLIEEKLAEAQKQANKILQNAQDEAEDIRKNAKHEGYFEGREAGFLEGKNEAEDIIQEALALKEEMIRRKENLARNFEKEMINLVIETLERVLNIKVSDCEETIMGLIKLGLDKCTFTDNLVIRVSPEDYGYVIASKDKILCLAENISNLEIRQDASLDKGSCIIDTASGSVDSSIATQLQHIKEMFLELLESE